jgi:hypothetical protein
MYPQPNTPILTFFIVPTLCMMEKRGLGLHVIQNNPAIADFNPCH